MIRRMFSLLALVALVLTVAAPVKAGGWAIAEMTSPVDNTVVNEETMLSFTVLQHGVTPVMDAEPVVTATHAETGEQIQQMAVPSDLNAGVYQVAMTFSMPGRWKLEVKLSPFPSVVSLPTINVDARKASLHLIEIGAASFLKGTIVIAVGDSVTWKNSSAIKHEVRFLDLRIDDSGIFGTGDMFSVRFDAPGEYHYVCGPHPGMNGTIIVK